MDVQALIKSIFSVGAIHALGRALGFIRDIVIAYVLGTSIASDTFYAVFRFTSLFRGIVGDGAINSAFVPVYNTIEHSHAKSRQSTFAGNARTLIGISALAITTALIICMPKLAQLLSPGLGNTREEQSLVIVAFSIGAFHIFLMSISALESALLNSHSRYRVVAFSSLVVNLFIITSIIYTHQNSSGFDLVCGLVLGAAVQLIILVSCRSLSNIPTTTEKPIFSSDIKKFVSLLGPVLVSGFILQANVYVGYIIASLFEGVVTCLFYAERIVQLPTGIALVALNSVFLPKMASAFNSSTHRTATKNHLTALLGSQIFALPICIFVSISAYKIIFLIFAHGAFSSKDLNIAARFLEVSAFAIPAVIGLRIVNVGFIARKNTKTPMKVAAIGLIINLIVAFGGLSTFGPIAISYGWVAGIWISFILSTFILTRFGFFNLKMQHWHSLYSLFLSAAIMALILLLIENSTFIPDVNNQPSKVITLCLLVIVGLASSTIFFLLLVGLKNRESRQVIWHIKMKAEVKKAKHR